MTDERKKPEEILKEISNQEEDKKRGKLKIFFGYAAGVGKTYSMLEAAHEAKKKGIDVVAGYIEPHARPETAALTKDLEMLPVINVEHHGITLKEFDVDGAIKRHPKLILIDELAHSNAEGCRNKKRYQDVEEMLKAGINVYTTINVQHIESIHDVVSSITGVSVKERIPDSVFDMADQVEIIDIEPQELLERLRMGKIYKESQAKRAVNHFFTVENLTALREIALRRCADQVNNISETNGSKKGTEEHILVCLSSSPSNAKIIRTASRMVKAFKANFTALYVESLEDPYQTEENKKRLKENMRLAEQFGAKIEVVYGEDIPFQIAEFARLSAVTKVVIGRSAAVKGKIFGRQTLVEKLISYAPLLDVYVIPDATGKKVYWKKKLYRKSENLVLDTAIMFAVLIVASIIGTIFFHTGFEEANIIMIYVLAVLIISVITHNRIFSFLSSLFSVLIFNFLFTVPIYTLHAYGHGYPVTFLIMFISALITSSLAVKLKNHAKQSAVVAYRTKILLDTSQSLQQAESADDIMCVTARQIIKLVKKDVITYIVEDEKLEKPIVHYVDDIVHPNDYVNEHEKAVAYWVMKNNKHAGATTQTLSNAKSLYLAVRVNQKVYGVIAIAIEKDSLEAFEKSILLSILGECALAIENKKNAEEKERVAVLAKNEQLRSNLLRAISHDLRTPLTSISGNASNFLANGDAMDKETKTQLFTDIYDDSMWLINLVENLLSVTRLEDNSMNLNITSELVEDVVDESLRHISRKKTEHKIITEYKDEFLLAKMDPRLIVQVIINLVDNAIKYTPVNSKIIIDVRKRGKKAVISVKDDGPGIPDDVKPKIFDMFYSGNTTVADSRRSLGLGLYLCKIIIETHGGSIIVKDNKPRGTVFEFTLPAGEVNISE